MSESAATAKLRALGLTWIEHRVPMPHSVSAQCATVVLVLSPCRGSWRGVALLEERPLTGAAARRQAMRNAAARAFLATLRTCGWRTAVVGGPEDVAALVEAAGWQGGGYLAAPRPCTSVLGAWQMPTIPDPQNQAARCQELLK